jgi:hypothetical protein
MLMLKLDRHSVEPLLAEHYPTTRPRQSFSSQPGDTEPTGENNNLHSSVVSGRTLTVLLSGRLRLRPHNNKL